MDNRLIIAEKTSKETRISFISNTDEEVEDYVAYGTYKSIGDNLTTAEFNAIVQLLRNNHILTDPLHIKNGTLNGEYGEYTFDIDSTTIVDNGILITNETLTNLGTVTLTSPSFNNATYTLYLTVYSYDDVNIMADETTTDPTITTLEIELIKDTPVNIPFNTLTSSCIVSFDAHINIKQDKPCIIGQIIDDVLLSVNPSIFQIGDTSTLTAIVNDKEGLPMANKTVSFYTSSSLINTSSTNSEGIATSSYTSTGLGKSDFTAKCLNYQSNSVSVTDAYFYDQAVTGKNNTNWYYRSGHRNGETNVLDDCTQVITDDAGARSLFCHSPNLNPSSLSDIRIYKPLEYMGEFDFISASGTVYLTQNSSVNENNRHLLDSIEATPNSHIKFWADGETNRMYYQVDDNEPTYWTSRDLTVNCGVGFRVNANSELKFKNFILYKK